MIVGLANRPGSIGLVLLNCVLAGSLMGCAEIPKDIVAEASHTPNGFVLGPEDVLQVTVWRNEDLSREVVVRPDGMISMPLIGDVQASGLTTDQLAARLADRWREFKESPVVSIGVKEVNSYYVYVLGEVRTPGKFQLRSYTTVLQAIALSGGFTEYASKNDMKVIRHSTNGNGSRDVMHIPVRYDDVMSGEGNVGDFILKSGDTVVVP